MSSYLFVFLHGFGYDKENNTVEMHELAHRLGADYLSFNAPFPSQRARGGYAWVPIQEHPRKWLIDEATLAYSAQFIRTRIDEESKKRGVSWDKVILAGRSQGACLAMYVGVTAPVPCRAVVSFCGLLHEDMSYHVSAAPPVIRVEAGQDTVLSIPQKESRKKIVTDGILVTYLYDVKSTHDDISFDAVIAVEKNIKNL